MSGLQFELHPISLVPLWEQALGEGWNATFSRYLYVPHSIEDKRTSFQIPLAEVTPTWLERQIDALPPAFELAMHSRLTRGHVFRHIPMIDFAAESQNGNGVLEWAATHLGISLHVFFSGRSFHAYGVEPVSHARWVRFMGLLLLGNMPGKPAIVDTRWIGHRLLAGYSALRWSKNSAHYVGMPTYFAGSLSRDDSGFPSQRS